MVEAEARGGESMRRKSTPSRSRESRGDENAIETAGKFSVQTPSINLPINRPDVAVGREGSSDSDRKQQGQSLERPVQDQFQPQPQHRQH